MSKVVNNLFNVSLRRNSFQINELDRFLQSKGAVSVVELHGLLTAVISAPEIILPSKWMQLSKIQDIDFASPKQANGIMQSIMSLYNDVSINLRQRTYKPMLYIPPSSDLAKVPEEEIWQQMIKNSKLWAKGYLVGETSWPFKGNLKFAEDIPSLSDIIDYLLLPSSELLKECAAIDITVENFYEMAINCLPSITIAVYDFWVQGYKEHVTKFSPKSTIDGTVGHNDFCPCGSGRKYNKCCLH